MYKIVFIDADDTLFDYKIAENSAITKVFEDNGYFKKHTEEDFKELRKEYKNINDFLWEELEKGNITSSELKVERFKRLFEKLNLEYNPEKISKEYLRNLSEGSFLFEGAEKFCKYLKSKYKIVIITNGLREVQVSRIKKSLIGEYIDELIISEEVGVSKPNKEIFEYALKKIEGKNNQKYEKKEIIMVGDSQSADIQGGINFGIDTCWVNIVGKKENLSIKSTYTVTKIEELYNIL